jgi:hypothetical protein
MSSATVEDLLEHAQGQIMKNADYAVEEACLW